ncbi:MAG: tRNA (N(6)-L-threonylcarbamoyladenosine(37)-C(2))-methylthiotransferase MtaB [Leptospiraceae bacterium]|nr:tRNA (N(6)-L-threonylcarbamoyladenosine(37)-C(2))-methylthiotransferase MtaB [Leptospiraceae bacterium]MDW8306779.1 tRNA (N(6)-L-threonylcarbamoyladenosine(37)-C(2))-methylthiotransferase MtaB [Leptospiraceae bacterium]
MARAFIVNFGCRLNSYEADALGGDLEKRGIILTSRVEEADFIFINTCTVTSRADAKNRSIIRSLHEKNPRAKIIVTGCYATTDGDELKNFPGVYQVIPNNQKANIPYLLWGEQSERTTDGLFGYGLPVKGRHSRAMVKIQDGCSRSCSYCKIPLARGPGRSRSFHEIIDYTRKLIEAGYHEITITGVNIGWYRGNHGESFEDLIETLLELEGDFYLRLSSLEPPEFSSRLCELFGHPRMAKFLHLPLQSGSKHILRLMRRTYNPDQYCRKVEAVRKKIPDIHVGTDIIVGFPSESEEDFAQTYTLCKELCFANIHIFPFSLRKNTPVEKMLQEKSVSLVPKQTIRQRIDKLRELSQKLKKEYQKKTAGLVYRGIVEKKGTSLHVTTENYVKLDVGLRNDISPGEMVYVRYGERGDLLELKKAL